MYFFSAPYGRGIVSLFHFQKIVQPVKQDVDLSFVILFRRSYQILDPLVVRNHLFHFPDFLFKFFICHLFFFKLLIFCLFLTLQIYIINMLCASAGRFFLQQVVKNFPYGLVRVPFHD